MAIKNYTTTVPCAKTVSEIQIILARKGASKVMTEYDPNGQVSALCFTLRIRERELPFAMPLRADAVYKVLEKERKAGRLPRPLLTHDQARRIGWRILRDWVGAQLALVEIGMADMEEVFMPYLWNPQTRQTLYEISKGKNFQNLLPQVVT